MIKIHCIMTHLLCAHTRATANTFHHRLISRECHTSAIRGRPRILALALALFALADTVHAAPYIWTNTTGAAFNDPAAWSPPSGPPGLNDTASFTVNGTVDLPLTNNYISNIGTLLIGAASGSGTLILTMDFGTNTFAGISANANNAACFVLGHQGTSTVYISCGSVLCTNTTGNARMIVGRNGPATVTLTNGFVAAGNLIIANNTSANGSRVVISGPNSSWSNSAAALIGSASGSVSNSLVISNSGSMVDGGTFQVGNGGFFNAFLLDTSGRLFTKNTGSIGASAGSSNNTATVQGGALWDCGGKNLFVGNTSGQNNSLIIGNKGTVSNVTFLILSGAGNSLVLSSGVLSVSSGITNASGAVGGSGTVVGNVVFTSAGTLSPGTGTSVGTLTFSNNLTLISGSTTILKLDNSQVGSNDQVNTVGGISEAGTLTIVTNGVAPLNIGDQYQLFVGSQSGSFSAINLPPLDPSELWDTSQLASAGILTVTFQPVLPGMVGPTDQVVTVGSSVTISATVTGAPTPTLQWQFNGVNTTDGATGNGSTLTGSTGSALTLANAQTADSGSYCLIASNGAGVATNCMALTVSNGNVSPSISGMSDQTVIQGNTGTFNAAVAGSPTPTVQWYQGATLIPGATGSPLILTNVQFSQNGFGYSIIATNIAGTATNSATLHVIITPAIQTQPQSLVVTNTQSASFTVVSTNGVPPPTYQWYFNNSTPITDATNAIYTIASASPTSAGTYKVQVSNAAGSVTSSNVTLTVDSTMIATLTPANGSVNVCDDTPLYLMFDQPPVESGAGKIRIYNVTNSITPVDTIDTGLGSLQTRTIGTESFNTYPVIITSNMVTIYPHLRLLSYNQTYYVTVDPATFTDTNGALYAGVTDTNAWRFTTRPTGPANPNDVTVAADGSGDFCTVQGAVDSLPGTNSTYTLVNIRNGTYTEIVDTRNRNYITFRGQSRAGTIVEYANNNSNNGSTHSRMVFKVYANDLAIENMTVVNTTPQGGSQAEALMIETGAARFILNNAEVDSRQDTILANVNSSQGYFYNSLVQGNYDFVWGGGNLFITNCEFRAIPTASNYNLAAPRTDNGTTPGGWLGPYGKYASNGFSFVNCLLSRSSGTVTNITMSDANGNSNGVAAWIDCNIDTTGGNGYVTPVPSVLSNQILWEYGNSNLDNSAAVDLGLTVLTNGDPRLECAGSATCWLYGWVPQLAPNILTNPVSATVTSGVPAAFGVAATGIPDPSYQWVKDSTNLVGATNATLVLPNPTDGDAGTYAVLVSNDAGSVTSSNATLSIVDLPPVANFSGAPTNGPTPLAVTFMDISTGTITNRFWDFGDGNTTNTTATTMDHSYMVGGTNTVGLTVFGPLGSSNLTRTAYIVVIDRLVANFNANPTAGVAPLLVHFTDTSAGTITNRFWDFGDGSTTNTTASGVDHTYRQAGTNTVNLTIFGPGGSSNTNQPNYIVVNPPDTTPPQLQIVSPTDYQAFTNAAITASGTASDASGLTGVTVNGASASLAGTNWSQSLALSLGTNTITVIATDASANLNTATQIVHAVLYSGPAPTNHPPQITTGLTVTNALLQVDSNSVVVTDETNTLTVVATDPDGDPLTYQWVFGDGANTNTALGMVDHVYTNDCGPYSARVTVSDGQASTNSDLTVVVACQMQIVKMQARPNFARANEDACTLIATIDLSTNFVAEGKSATVDVGGAQLSFVLDTKGVGASPLGVFRLKYDKKADNWTVTVKLHKGNWQTPWAIDGLANANVSKPGNSVTLTAVVLVDNQAFVADQTLLYTAKAGKSGIAR